MSNANLKYVNFTSNTWLEWMTLHNDIVDYLNSQVYTNSVSDSSTSNIATAGAINTVHSRAISLFNQANTNLSLAQGSYNTSNSLYVMVQELSEYANSYSGWRISSNGYRYGVLSWVDENGTTHLGSTIEFHSANNSSNSAANINYDSANNLFDLSSGLKTLHGIETIAENTVIHIANNSMDVFKLEANGQVTGTISGSELIWISTAQMANSSFSTYESGSVSIPVFDFHQAVQANNGLTISLPKSWDQENVSVQLYGITTATTGDAIFKVNATIAGDNELISHSGDGTQIICSAQSSANGLSVSSDFTELDVTNKVSAGSNNESILNLVITRDISDLGDTMNQTFRLIGAKIKYNKRYLTDL